MLQGEEWHLTGPPVFKFGLAPLTLSCASRPGLGELNPAPRMLSDSDTLMVFSSCKRLSRERAS